MNFLALISAKAWGYVAASAAVLVAVAKIFYAGKKSAQVDGMKEQLQNVETRNEIETAVSAADRSERERLRDKWTKPPSGV